MIDLTRDEKKRYNRQIQIPAWGPEGQQLLKKSTLFVAGAGGLGSPVLYYLVSAGIGKIIICDHGMVENSNLNRQILYTSDDVGRSKVDVAAERLHALNPLTTIETHAETLDLEHAQIFASGTDLIIDCLDNFETRFILNQVSTEKGIPFIHAGIRGYSGQVTFIQPPHTPCLQCIIPEPPEAETVPVAGMTAGIIGSIEALEAIKYLLKTGELLTNILLLFDGETTDYQRIKLQKNPQCPVCGDKE
jgi:adenylyltransferase/sulfurtransferase